ncbi:Protein CBG02525 [Caenorhabditis briggsae]|uniref:Uncharacterized protein n=2 Tax=Caenorhabditis briggsae TaxID=6238 RepID=A0AAE9EDV2_CAEBR|nr:Protein CBG02525 [Caenorhabditis briggsae]ULU06759.1 hypothetical protein L3Y34_018513 [Caenorhabditis briggsae]UMM18686.1 hypothetical protein L5515_014633 [Caenorhabditis briggsae]CAP24003.1 Protein CBG02525 [Caenorhabditis briggsae]
MIASKGLSLFIFAAFVTVTSAQLMCQYGKSIQHNNGTIVYSRENGPDKPIMCPGSFCMRIYQKHNNYQQNSYGCANGACTSDGCTENSNGFGSCCCHGDYCNSGVDVFKTTLSSMILTMVYMCL